MTQQPPKPLKTRERLLLTASTIFAEKGYHEATIAEICQQAETNIAAVNYHFQDKENLYLQAWRHAFQKDLTKHPADGGIGENEALEVRLAGRIRSLITRIADPESHFFAIVNKEMARQTNVFAKMMEQEIKPQHQAMNQLVSQLLGETANQQQIQFCHASIIGQCFHWLKIQRHKDNETMPCEMLKLEGAEHYIEHVINFSLAGIKAIREQNSRSIGDLDES